VAADPRQDRHVMSQTTCERREFAVPMRWRNAGGDLSRHNHADQPADRPSIRSTRRPRYPLHASRLPCTHPCRSPGAGIAPFHGQRSSVDHCVATVQRPLAKMFRPVRHFAVGQFWMSPCDHSGGRRLHLGNGQLDKTHGRTRRERLLGLFRRFMRHPRIERRKTSLQDHYQGRVRVMRQPDYQWFRRLVVGLCPQVR